MSQLLTAGRVVVLAALAVFPTLLPPAAASAAEPPSAFELLERVRARYGRLESYAASGVLEIRRGPGEGEPAGRFRLSIWKGADGAFRLELVEVGGEESGETAAAGPEPPRLVIWRRRGEGSFVYDGARGEAGEYRPADSTLAALAELPGGRELGVEAHPIAALLAGGEGALSRPPAASLDGPEPCPGAPAAACRRLRHPSSDGRLESELWVETGEPVVRRVEVRTVADPLGFAAALADAGLDPGLRPAADRPQVVVRTTFDEAGTPSAEPVARVVLGPPAGARRVETWSEAAPEGEGGGPQIAFGETIDVALAGFVVRVVDGRGDPVTGLGPDDFRVTAGGRELPVHSVDYYASGSGASPDLRAPDHRAAAARDPASPARPAAPGPPPPDFPPKLVVLFVQADFNSIRIRGHLKMLPFVELFLDALPPDDLVAVVSFDSHLEPWLDLTTDRDAAHDAVWRAIHFGADPPSGRRIEPRRGPSLFERIDPGEAADAAWPETALEIVARALVPLPGEKVVVFLGWGLGYRTRGGVRMRRDYRPAIDALTAARASVFAIDVTDAHYHDLELGLKQVAADTGGTYERTVDFPTQAIRRLTALLTSHYVLTVDLADLPAAARRGREELEVELVGHRGARLLVRPLSP